MPTTGNDLLAYQGNKNLGSGTNADVPAIDENANLNPIIDAGKNIMLLDAERNMKLFQQKLIDRDKRLQLFNDGQIASGNILDQDRPVYEKAKKDANDAFDKMIDAGGLNNPKAYAEYQSKVNDLQNTVTHAQERWTQAGLLKSEQAQQTIPSKIKDYQNHIDNELKKPFNQFIDPYQHLLDFDNDKIVPPIQKGALLGGATTPTATTDKTTVTTKNGKSTTTQTETTGAAKGKQQLPVTDIVYKDGLPYSRVTQHYSLGKMNENAIAQYFEPEGGGQQDLLVQKIQQLPPYQQKDALNHLIQRAEDYNRDNGYTEGKDKDAAPVSKYKKAFGYDDTSGSVMPNPVTGKINIGLPAPEFAALWSLGHVEGNYAPTTDTFLKDEAKQSEENREDKVKDAIGWEKAKAYADLTNFKLSQAKTESEQNQALDDMYTRNLTEQKSLIQGQGKDKMAIADIQADKSLPVYTIDGKTPTLLQPIGSTPVYGKGNQIVGYNGGHYEQQYLFNGRPLDVVGINKMYENYESAMNKKGKEAGGRDNFIRGLIQNGIYDVKLIGANGSTDKKVSTAAQRIINNLDTKKDQTGVFDTTPPTDEPNKTEIKTVDENKIIEQP